VRRSCRLSPPAAAASAAPATVAAAAATRARSHGWRCSLSWPCRRSRLSPLNRRSRAALAGVGGLARSRAALAGVRCSRLRARRCRCTHACLCSCRCLRSAIGARRAEQSVEWHTGVACAAAARRRRLPRARRADCDLVAHSCQWRPSWRLDAQLLSNCRGGCTRRTRLLSASGPLGDDNWHCESTANRASRKAGSRPSGGMEAAEVAKASWAKHAGPNGSAIPSSASASQRWAPWLHGRCRSRRASWSGAPLPRRAPENEQDRKSARKSKHAPRPPHCVPRWLRTRDGRSVLGGRVGGVIGPRVGRVALDGLGRSHGAP
jgi:hypothetical protein